MLTVRLYLHIRESRICSLLFSHMNTSMRDAANGASPHHVVVLFGFQMLSPWYDEFLDEEDYWFLIFTVGGTLSWGGIKRF